MAGSGEERDERIEQHGGRDRLEQEAVHLDALGFFADLLAPEGGDEHDRRTRRQVRILFDQTCRLNAVHAGHSPVHEDDVVGPVRVVLSDGGDGFLARAHRIHSRADADERVHQNVPRGGIVIHHQGRDSAKLFGNDPAPRQAERSHPPTP